MRAPHRAFDFLGQHATLLLAGGMREFAVGAGGASPRTAAIFHYGVLKLTLGAGGYARELRPREGGSLTGKGNGSCNKKCGA